MSIMKNVVVINQLDNVGVLLKESNGISAGHKIALKNINKNIFIN